MNIYEGVVKKCGDLYEWWGGLKELGALRKPYLTIIQKEVNGRTVPGKVVDLWADTPEGMERLRSVWDSRYKTGRWADDKAEIWRIKPGSAPEVLGRNKE